MTHPLELLCMRAGTLSDGGAVIPVIVSQGVEAAHALDLEGGTVASIVRVDIGRGHSSHALA